METYNLPTMLRYKTVREEDFEAATDHAELSERRDSSRSDFIMAMLMFAGLYYLI